MSREEVQNDIQYPIQNERLDLVSVVRCKDCAKVEIGHGKYSNWYFCNWWGHDVTPDDFCSRGERRDV